MKIPGKFASAALTAELKKLAGEIIDVDEAGNPVSREQAIAKTLWNLANGWTEKKRDDDGNLTSIYHEPVGWAIQYVFERLEGRAAQAKEEESGGMKAAQKVSELAKERLNKLAAL